VAAAGQRFGAAEAGRRPLQPLRQVLRGSAAAGTEQRALDRSGGHHIRHLVAGEDAMRDGRCSSVSKKKKKKRREREEVGAGLGNAAAEFVGFRGRGFFCLVCIEAEDGWLFGN